MRFNLCSLMFKTRSPEYRIRGMTTNESEIYVSRTRSMTEKELLSALDEHDMLVGACVRGDLDFTSFVTRYDTFYHRWALDGHESDNQELQLLAKYVARVDVHRRVYDEILTNLCSDEDAENLDYRKAGRFGSDEGNRRLRRLAQEVGLFGAQAG